jgi:pantetheine-phosphate adenylyltransferase
LDLAAFYSDSVQIGLISRSYLSKHQKENGDRIQDYQKRASNISKHLNDRKASYSIVVIDKIGKDRELATKSDLKALVVSQETYPGALLINTQRKKIGKNPLMIILVPLVVSKKGSKISSTQIRKNLRA